MSTATVAVRRRGGRAALPVGIVLLVLLPLIGGLSRLV